MISRIFGLLSVSPLMYLLVIAVALAVVFYWTGLFRAGSSKIIFRLKGSDYFLAILSISISIPSWLWGFLNWEPLSPFVKFLFGWLQKGIGHGVLFILIFIVFTAVLIPVMTVIEGLRVFYFVLSAGTLFDLKKREALGKEYRRLIPDVIAIGIMVVTYLCWDMLGINELWIGLGSL